MSNCIVTSFPQQPAPTGAGRTELRRAFGCFGTGVTIMTTFDPQSGPVGLTANSFASVSLDPPLVSWNIQKSIYSFDLFDRCRHFAVNVLANDQRWISEQMARPSNDKFRGIDFHSGPGEVPILHNTSATFVCENLNRIEAGDHVIIIGQVLEYSYSDAPPLLYACGKYLAGVALDPDVTRRSVIA